MRTAALPSALLAFVGFVGLADSAQAQTIGIAGSGLGCNHSTVAAAVAAAAPGSTLYLLAGASYNEAVSINKDLTLTAGNSTCNGSAWAGAAHPVIDGQSVRRPLAISGGADVVLDRVDLARGSATEGGNARLTSGSLQLVDSSVYLGVADEGGGIYVGVGASLVLEGDTIVTWNVADVNGGGAFVEGEIELRDGVVIGDGLLGNVATWGGGGIHLSAGSGTMHEGAAIIGNDSDFGAGVALMDGGSFIMLGGRIGGPGGEANETNGMHVSGSEFVMLGGEIAYNHGFEGGGVAVSSRGTGAILGWSRIHHNDAWFGGGIALHESDGFTIEGEISDNVATGDGGGIAVANVYGPLEIHGANILRNEAATAGGGIYLHYAESVTIVGTWINDNVAGTQGGGIFMSGIGLFGVLTQLTMSGPRTDQEGCDYRGQTPADVYCSELRGNTADEGGAWYSLFGDAFIEETAVIANQATVQGGAMVLEAPFDPTVPNRVELKNVLFARNECPEADVIRVENGAELAAAHVTSTRNEGTPVHYLGGALGYLRRSIVWEDESVVIDAPLVLPSACTSFNTVSGATSGVSRAFATDPQFVITARGHYRLDSVTSINSVDRCSAGAAGDLDSDPRPAGPLVSWDRGAFEAQ